MLWQNGKPSQLEEKHLQTFERVEALPVVEFIGKALVIQEISLQNARINTSGRTYRTLYSNCESSLTGQVLLVDPLAENWFQLLIDPE